MAAARGAAENAEILSSLVDTLELCSSKVKEGSLGQVMEDLETNFSLQDFWMKFGMTFRAVSKEATKLAAMHSKPPLPTPMELQSLLTGFETAIIAMLTVFLSLPLTQGKTLHKRIQKAVSVIVEDSKIFIQALMTGGGVSNQATGALWEHCGAFSTFPLDNKHAVLDVIKTTFDLVKDAITELEQLKADNGRHDDNPTGDGDDHDGNEQGWSAHDIRLVPHCIMIGKVCRGCLKKVLGAIRTNGKATSNQMVLELDQIENIVQNISPRVDDFFSTLYTPMNHIKVYEKGHELANILRELLAKTRNYHFTVEDDAVWLEIFNKGIDQNITKLSSEIEGTPQNGGP